MKGNSMKVSFLSYRLIVTLSSLMFMSACSTLSEKKHVNADNALLSQTPKKAITIASAIPVLDSMARVLAENSVFETVYIPPARYSIKRIPGWLKRQDKQTFPDADIALGMTSVWPSIDIYPAIRLKNIGVIEIDAAHALIPNGERVAVTPNSDNVDYFWLNPANAIMMLGIIHRDLLAVSKRKIIDHALLTKTLDQLNANFNEISQALRKVQLEIDNKLNQIEVLQVVIDKPEQKALADAIGVPLTTLDDPMIEDFPILFITTKKPNHKSLIKLPKSALVWHIDAIDKFSEKGLLERYQELYDGL
ncbi:hypothetical protein A3715_11585 [Oleiphilus sp. HI0009]|nr:hypothetical protein A3715_24990 [Oleiphilus sp. HI0009]KZX77113.1 hypothetical protein A3715_11585 [Oleiphilus sp. HI0009]